jgi:transcriptional regulator of acetoin/glycerol metabolism
VGSHTPPDHTDRLCELLKLESWPGNVRELKARVKSLHQAANGDIAGMVDHHLDDSERTRGEQLSMVLEAHGWNRTKAALLFGVSEGTIRNWIQKYDLHERA